MAKISSGFFNEIELSNELNGKSIGKSSFMYREMLEKLYVNINDTDIVYSEVSFDNNKYISI